VLEVCNPWRHCQFKLHTFRSSLFHSASITIERLFVAIEGSSELFTVFPVFLLVDVSASMAGGPIEALNASLPDLKKEMMSNPTVGEIARVGLVTFSDQSRVVLPLCDLAFAEIPEVLIEGGTNFAAAFRGVRAAINDGMSKLPRGTPVCRPVVFFMSDGEHTAREDWRAPLAAVRDQTWRFSPELVTFGFGDANQQTIREIATRYSFLAKEADPATQVREILNALIGSIRTTSTSFQDPNQAEGLHVEAPTKFFTPLPPIQL